MNRLSLAICFALVLGSPALAAEPCEACRAGDIDQVGPYVEPALPVPDLLPKAGDRGKEQKIPMPGGPVTMHVKPGAGVWLGSPGEGKGDVFVNGSRDKASVGWRLGF